MCSNHFEYYLACKIILWIHISERVTFSGVFWSHCGQVWSWSHSCHGLWVSCTVINSDSNSLFIHMFIVFNHPSNSSNMFTGEIYQARNLEECTAWSWWWSMFGFLDAFIFLFVFFFYQLSIFLIVSFFLFLLHFLVPLLFLPHCLGYLVRKLQNFLL